ncbi:hypothetical protein ACHMXB_07735 [Arthrobacter sp. UC242_113]|uniref:hypothetical protein n=1 Tax=Arthrobacter sp. UC242_113 TaxID=3374550 RepID=UPI0037583D29
MIALLAAAAALGLAGCGSSPTQGVSPDTPPSAVAPSGAAAGYSGQLIPFTFPDRPLSFQYPVEWHAGYFEGGGQPSLSGTATVSDPQSTNKLTAYLGQMADAVSHPVNRTVFESEPVPGLSGQPAPAANYSFYVDRTEGKPTYRMHLTAGAPAEGKSTALDGIIRVGEEVLVAEVNFQNAFADDDAAKVWLAGAEGQALKALLLSMSYG